MPSGSIRDWGGRHFAPVLRAVSTGVVQQCHRDVEGRELLALPGGPVWNRGGPHERTSVLPVPSRYLLKRFGSTLY